MTPLVTALLAAIALVVRPVASTCTLSQKGPNGIPFRDVHEPAPLPVPPGSFPCPEYTELACCNQDQWTALMIHLELSGLAFAKPSEGGNPACGENLRQLWCGLTCHPNQSLWMAPADNTTVIDGAEVLPATVSLGSVFGCGLFESCKATEKAAEDAVLSTSTQSFLNYMGQTQGKTVGVWYTFEFFGGSSNETESTAAADGAGGGDGSSQHGLVPGAAQCGGGDVDPDDVMEGGLLPYWAPPLQYCCNYNSSIYALNTGGDQPPGPIPPSGNISSPCASCSSSCPNQVCGAGGGGSGSSSVNVSQLEAPIYGVMYGFDMVTFIGVYGLAIVVTVAAVLWNRASTAALLSGDMSAGLLGAQPAGE